jgi:hypothetical protein
MRIKIGTSDVKESKWYEYAIRFGFGGTVTALTGIVAKHFGPEIGGLFLAFPAILPAAATLIEKEQTERKLKAGMQGVIRGRQAAGVDAAGAAMGSIGLIFFALIVWKLLPASSTAMILIEATLAWLVVSVSLWLMREKMWRAMRRYIRRKGSRRRFQH